MVTLLIICSLSVAIAILKWAIGTSDKLSATWWKFLACLSTTLLIFFYADGTRYSSACKTMLRRLVEGKSISIKLPVHTPTVGGPTLETPNLPTVGRLTFNPLDLIAYDPRIVQRTSNSRLPRRPSIIVNDSRKSTFNVVPGIPIKREFNVTTGVTIPSNWKVLFRLERLPNLTPSPDSKKGAAAPKKVAAAPKPDQFCFMAVASHGSRNMGEVTLYGASNQWSPFRDSPLQGFFERRRDEPHVAPPEENNFRKDLLFWITLMGMMVSPATSVATILFAWVSLHRRRAEALLMRMELEKRKLEIEQLRRQLERESKETDEAKAASSNIILLS